MKLHFSLRARITLLTGAVIAAVAVLLTVVSMANASDGLHSVSNTAMAAITITTAASESDDYTVATGIRPDVILSPKETGAASFEGTIDGQMLSISSSAVDARRKFNVLSIACLIGAVLLGMGAAYLLAGRALAPVRRLSQAAGEISAHNLQRRLEPSAARDEIGSLTNAFNAMLDRLQDSFDSQKRFSSNVAHELKTPLATMKMSLQVARIENHDPENTAFFETAERSVDRLSGVVTDLLTLTDEAPTELCDELHPAALLREVAFELSSAYAGKNLRVTADCEEDAAVPGNAGLARRLFYNLVENAMKYGAPGGAVRLAARRTPEGLCVTVSDDGPGVPEDALPHIFEPFYCADPSRSRKLGGAGLGLSIARTIAARHGWTLTAANATEGGAVFTVTIPETEILK